MMTRHRQSRLRVVMFAAIVAAGAGLHCRADVVSNCFKVVNYSVCWHVECTLDGFTNALDLAIDDNANNGFRVGDHGSRQYTKLAAVESGETIDAGTFIRLSGMVEFANQSDFIVAFAVGCSEINRIDGNFGWVRLAYEGGTIVLKGGAINTTQGSPLVAEGVDDGPDEPVEGLIWRCNFNGGVQGMEITNMPDVASHTLLVGDEFEALIDDGRYSGRFCAGIDGAYGARAWFSVNERSTSGLGPRYVPDKWHTLRTSFKIYSNRAWEAEDDGLYADIPQPSEEENTRRIQLIVAPGSIINIDDKLALRYCESEYDDGNYWWEVNAGITNGVGTLEAQTVRLLEKERGDEPTSPVKNWVKVEIEAVNDDSPHGLAYRIYIDGALLCSEEDGGSVFRARPVATDKGGVTALGIGGAAFIDDIVFSSTTIDPLSGVRISPSKFGQGNVELTDDELANLAGIIGFESLSVLEYVTLLPWEDKTGTEPEDAAKVCIDLGISPCEVKSAGDGRELMMFFKYPTVRAVGIDPSSRTVTGQIVPAEGTRIVQPTLNFMFGIMHYMDFGTPYAHTEDYGGSIYQNHDGWQLDISDYAASNGLFRITYDPKFSDEGTAFFLLSIKDYRYWW